MEKFLRRGQKGSPHTPDPREEFLEPKSEVFRLLHGSQALGYLRLYAATGKQPYLHEAIERLEALQGLDDIWSNTAWDGELALAFLKAYEFTSNYEFFETGIAAAERLANYCWLRAAYGSCDLNWGLNAAACLAQAYRLTGQTYFLSVTRQILAQTQAYQHSDGSFPHQADVHAKNLAYSSWMAFQLMTYLDLDPDIVNVSDFTIIYRGRIVTLDVELMLSRLIPFLKRQVTQDGSISYTGGWELEVRIDPQCRHCSNPLFPQCKAYCLERCGPTYVDHPCGCIEDPLTECDTGKKTVGGPGSNGPDFLCLYCSNPMYTTCASACSSVCVEHSAEFPCHCVSNPETDCPRDSIWTEITYYDDWNPHYDTRGWTSELASTAFALARAGEHEAKWRVLDFLFSLQNDDGSFPDKWGYRTEEPGTGIWLWASEEHSVIRTSIIFRVLSSLLVPPTTSPVAQLSIPDESTNLQFSPTPFQLTSIFPNPSAGEVTVRLAAPPGSGQAKLVVLDIAGRVVRSFLELPGSARVFEVTWDGADEDGRPVTAGVYFVQVIGEGWQSARKLVILRP